MIESRKARIQAVGVAMDVECKYRHVEIDARIAYNPLYIFRKRGTVVIKIAQFGGPYYAKEWIDAHKHYDLVAKIEKGED